MDTPGFSSLYVNEFEKEELEILFFQFASYEGLCKFQGCDHIHEGADLITVHLEACEDVDATLAKIKECRLKAGISICPDTPVSALEPYVDK